MFHTSIRARLGIYPSPATVGLVFSADTNLSRPETNGSQRLDKAFAIARVNACPHPPSFVLLKPGEVLVTDMGDVPQLLAQQRLRDVAVVILVQHVTDS